MKSKVYSFISAKGGSGKTILTATISDFLSQLGKKVLMIDADSSTNGLSLFYLDELLEAKKENEKKPAGIFEKGYSYSSNNLIQIENGVYLLPATYQFKNTDNFSIELFSDHLRDTINFASSELELDYVLIDCQAGSDTHSEAVINPSISNEIIIVSEYDPISVAGVERLKGLFNNELTYERTWVLLNKVLPELAESNNEFLEISKYLPPILWDAEVVKNYARKEIALDFNYGNEYTLSIIKLIKTLFGKKLSKELSEWLEKKNEIIKKPIYKEYQELKFQLEEYQNKKKSILNSSKLFLISSLASIVGLVTSIISFIGFNNDLSIVSTKLSPIIWTMMGIFVAMFVYSLMTYFNKRRQLDLENQYEKEILIARLQELELLKHSSIEKILRSNRKRDRTTLHNKKYSAYRNLL